MKTEKKRITKIVTITEVPTGSIFYRFNVWYTVKEVKNGNVFCTDEQGKTKFFPCDTRVIITI